MKKLHKLVYVHYNMRLRVRNLMQVHNNEDSYNPIDLNHIFHDDDILDEWIREAEQPVLSSDDLDWLDEGICHIEQGKKAANEDDGMTSRRISRHTFTEGKAKDNEARRKGKAVRRVSSTSSDDSDNDDNMSNNGGGRASTSSGNGGRDSGDDDGGASAGGDGDCGGRGGYTTHPEPNLPWTQRDENYHATQDTDHGYRPGIWEQRKHLEKLTTFSSNDDYSSGHDSQNIDARMQVLHIRSGPHLSGVHDRSYHRSRHLDSGGTSGGSFHGVPMTHFRDYSEIAPQARNYHEHDRSSSSSSVGYRGFGYYHDGVDPNRLPQTNFPDYGSSSQSSHGADSNAGQFFHLNPYHGNYCSDLYPYRKTDDDDDIEPPRHSMWS